MHQNYIQQVYAYTREKHRLYFNARIVETSELFFIRVSCYLGSNLTKQMIKQSTL